MNSDKNNDEEILIVEDSPTQAEMLKFLLDKYNYGVSVAYNGREALEMINKRKPAIVISDIVMPEMDGYELCKRIKENGNLKDIPVILLTALSDSKDVIRGLEAGADNFFTKPYEEKYLIAIVQYLLANRTLRVREKTEKGIKIFFRGEEYNITAERQQILNLLLSTYDTAVQRNIELQKTQDELKTLNEQLEQKVEKRTASLRAEIDVRRRTEEKLREASLYTRSLIEVSLDPLVTISPAGKITDVNKATELVTGVSREKLIASDFSDYFTEPEKAREGYRLVFDKGFVKDYPLAIRHTSGKMTDVLYNATVYKNEMGELQGVFAAARDITERKRAEEARSRLVAIIEFSDDAIFSKTLDGIIVSWNPGAEKLYGYSADEVIGKPASILIPQSYSDEMPNILERIKHGKTIAHYEAKRVKKDGKQIDVSLTISPIKDDAGKIIGASTIARDITELKKAEEIYHENLRLEFADKAKSEFLANMSHELRTPLNASIGFSELLRQGTAGELNEKQKHYVDNILTSNQFLLTLINDILDLSKIEAGKVELTHEKMSVPLTVKETLSLIKEKAMKHNVLLKTEFDPGLEFIEADKQRFKQILFNLLSNAVKFSKEEGGTVTIRAKKEGGMAKISISDTGIGIKEENIGRLFRKFEQLESGIGKKYGGTGLGLSITKQLVELHGGRIQAKSSFGEGSTFTFTLPIEAKRGKQIRTL